MLRDSRESKAALTEITTQIDGLALLEKQELEHLEEKLAQYKTKSEKLSKKYSKLHEQELQQAFLEESKPLFKKWEKLTSHISVKSAKDVDSLLREANKQIQIHKDNEKYFLAKKIYEKELNTYKKEKERLKEKLSKFDSVPDNFQEKFKDLTRRISKLEGIEEKTFDEELFESLKKYKHEDPKYLSKKKEKYSNALVTLRNTVQVLSGLEGHSQCPTCLNKVDSKLSKTLIDEAKKDVIKTKKKLEKIKFRLNNVEKYNELIQEKKDYVMYLKSKEELERLSRKKEKMESCLEYFTLKEKLESLSCPKEPTKPVKLTTNEDIDFHRSVAQVAPLVLPSFQRYYETKNNSKLRDVRDSIEQLKLELNSINNKIPKLTSKIDLAKASIKEYRKLKARRKELNKKASDVEILEMLVDAYSNRGIKFMIIKNIAALVEKNMNKYAPLVYPEKVDFKFSVVNDREFSILARIGKSSRYEDVRTLSGAESRAFSYLLPLALMPLIPKERRLNLMVLDEPTNNMGSARLELFVKNFVPKLNQLVPHLVIISTTTEQYKNCETYQVTKSKGKSVLEKVA